VFTIKIVRGAEFLRVGIEIHEHSTRILQAFNRTCGPK